MPWILRVTIPADLPRAEALDISQQNIRAEMKKALFIIASLAFWVISIHAAIPVSWNGTGTITFDTQPTIADGWSSLSVPGLANSITTVEALQTAAITNSAAFINRPLGTSTTYPPALNTLARWNYNTTNGYFLQTRATGNAYTILLCTLSNATGAAQFYVDVTYELGAIVASDSTINEHIDGHLAFWSLTGNPNDWHSVPEFSIGTPGFCAASLYLDIWNPDALLYLMWVDDNGPSDDTPPLREGAYTIDYFAVASQGVDPPFVTISPMQSSVLQCSTLSLRAYVAGGIPPYRYQWYRNPVALTNATNNFLILSNIQPSDAGDYFVTVYDSTPVSPDFGFSMLSTVTVIPQTNATVLLGASCSTNLQTITATFNQPVTISSPTGADFGIHCLNGDFIQSVPVISAVLTNGTNVIINTAAPLSSFNYSLWIRGTGVRGACLGDIVSNSVRITQNILLIGLADNTQWYYWEGTDPGPDWLTRSMFTWPVGEALFDFRRYSYRTYITGTGDVQVPVRTWLNLANNYYIPTYYFRTTFHWPVSPSSVTALHLTTFWDDGAILYVNGQELFRLRMTNGTDYGSYSGWSAPAADANFEGPFLLPATNLVQGINEVAVMLKQATSGSADITMGLSLIASVTKVEYPSPLRVRIRNNYDGTVTVSWMYPGGILQEASELSSSPDSWTDSLNQTNGVARPITGPKFFRVRWW